MSGIVWLEQVSASVRVLHNILYKRLDPTMSSEEVEECIVICASIELWLDRLDSEIEPLADELIAGQEAIQRAKKCERCQAQTEEGAR